MLLCCLRRNVDMLLVIHVVVVSRHQHKLRAYQRLVSSTRHGQSRLNVLHLTLQPFTTRDGARYWLRIAIYANLTCIRRPPLRGRGSCWNIAMMTFGTKNLEWCGYPTVKKF